MRRLELCHLLSLILTILLVSCRSREDQLFNFKMPKDSGVRATLQNEFGPPDSVVVICEKDTALLYKVKHGCVEWRINPRDRIRFSVSKNDSCKIMEGRYFVQDFDDLNPGFKKMEKELDSLLKKADSDSAFAVLATSHYDGIKFVVTSSDTGELKKAFDGLASSDFQTKKSVIDVFCHRLGGDYLIKSKINMVEHIAYFGASNYPDSSYMKIEAYLDALLRHRMNHKWELL